MSIAQMNYEFYDSGADDAEAENDSAEVGPTADPSRDSKASRGARPKRLHRIRITRRQQGLSLRSAAKRMEMSAEEAREQEKATTNISLGDLYRWQRALEVPVAHLLIDLDGPLSGPVLKRARMVRIMKTAGALAHDAHSPKIRRLAEMMVEQLIEIMPELKDVSPWHVVGQRRRLDEYGRAAERTLPDSFFYESGF